MQNNIPFEYRHQISLKILPDFVQQYDLCRFSSRWQSWFNISKLINVIPYSNKKITKLYYFNGIVKKKIDKISTFFNDENTEQTRNRRELAEADKRHILEKPKANFKLNGKRRKISSKNITNKRKSTIPCYWTLKWRI